MINEKLKTDLVESQKSKNAKRVDAIRLLISEINNAEIALRGEGKNLNDEEILKVLTREAKKRKESIEIYTNAKRQELADGESAELKIIEEYLPEQIGEEEVKKVVQAAIDTLGGKDSTDFGSVMRESMSKLKGKADGKVVSEIVKKLLV